MADLVRVEVTTEKFEEVLRAYSERLNGVPFDFIVEGLVTAIDDLIQNEGNGEWPPLLPSTLKRHPRRRGGQLLQDTGLLAQIQESPGGRGKDWVEVQSPAPYSIFHVSEAPRKIIPLRDFLAIDIDAVLENLGEELLAEVEG